MNLLLHFLSALFCFSFFFFFFFLFLFFFYLILPRRRRTVVTEQVYNENATQRRSNTSECLLQYTQLSLEITWNVLVP